MTLSAESVPSRRVLVVAGAFGTFNALLFLSIAKDAPDGDGLISHDQTVLTWFSEHRTDWLVQAARCLSTIGSFVSLLVDGVDLALWLRRRGAP